MWGWSSASHSNRPSMDLNVGLELSLTFKSLIQGLRLTCQNVGLELSLTFKSPVQGLECGAGAQPHIQIARPRT